MHTCSGMKFWLPGTEATAWLVRVSPGREVWDQWRNPPQKKMSPPRLDPSCQQFLSISNRENWRQIPKPVIIQALNILIYRTNDTKMAFDLVMLFGKDYQSQGHELMIPKRTTQDVLETTSSSCTTWWRLTFCAWGANFDDLPCVHFPVSILNRLTWNVTDPEM